MASHGRVRRQELASWLCVKKIIVMGPPSVCLDTYVTPVCGREFRVAEKIWAC